MNFTNEQKQTLDSHPIQIPLFRTLYNIIKKSQIMQENPPVKFKPSFVRFLAQDCEYYPRNQLAKRSISPQILQEAYLQKLENNLRRHDRVMNTLQKPKKYMRKKQKQNRDKIKQKKLKKMRENKRMKARKEKEIRNGVIELGVQPLKEEEQDYWDYDDMVWEEGYDEYCQQDYDQDDQEDYYDYGDYFDCDYYDYDDYDPAMDYYDPLEQAMFYADCMFYGIDYWSLR